jgi:hypothetical protein
MRGRCALSADGIMFFRSSYPGRNVMLKLFITSAVLLASVTYAWAPPATSYRYYNSHNFTTNSNGTVKVTPKYQASPVYRRRTR